MEKIDFCFLSTETSATSRHHAFLAKEFKKRGLSSFFITTSEAGDQVFKSENLSNFQNIDHLAAQEPGINDLEKIMPEIEKKFDIPNLRAEILTDKMVFRIQDENIMLKKFIKYLLTYEKLFNTRINADYYVQGVSASLNGRAFYFAARARGKHVYFTPAPFPGLYNFSFHKWGILEINQNEEIKNKQEVIDFIAGLKANKKWNLMSPLKKANPHVTKDRLKSLWNLLRKGKSEHLPAGFLFKNFWRRYVRQFLAKKFYSMPKKGEKYVFFPLHFPDDSQLTLRAMPFISQEYIIEIISRYLPYGYVLYVKEHPASVGSFSLRMLKYISKLPNVRIIPPLLNPYVLIENSQFICVINSTVGMESLLYQKPVITFGESFYRGKGVTLDISDLYGLAEAISKAKDFKPNWDEILRLFYLWKKNSFPPPPLEVFYTNQPPDAKKISQFCDALLQYLNYPKN